MKILNQPYTLAMKHLTLIRHAKSSWEDTKLKDFERPLNQRGKHDAPRLGAWLCLKKLRPDIIWCSNAKRARATLKGMRKNWEVDDLRIRYRRDLYTLDAIELIDTISYIHQSVNDLVIIGHNPCLEDLFNLLATEPCAKFVTCAVARLKLSITSWEQIHSIAQTAKIVYLQQPKLLPKDDSSD